MRIWLPLMLIVLCGWWLSQKTILWQDSPLWSPAAYAYESVSRLFIGKTPPISMTSPAIHTDNPEAVLMKILENVQNDRFSQALDAARFLTDTYPNFRLGQLIYGDLLIAQTVPVEEIGAWSGEKPEALSGLQEEIKARWRHYHTIIPENRLPQFVIRMGEDISSLVFIEMSTARLYVLENKAGKPVLVDNYYVSTGRSGAHKLKEGDKKTPVGIYRIMRRLESRNLPDLYGEMAFPLDYPNEWDTRNKRTGSGIWIHGSPSNTHSRPPKDTDGCAALSNSDLRLLEKYFQKSGKSIAFLVEEISWVNPESLKKQEEQFLARLRKWASDWENKDLEHYLSYYSKEFRSADQKTFDDWRTYKQGILARQTDIQISLENISIFQYPGEKNLLMIRFDQRYQSNAISTKIHKRQYWQKETDGVWRILYEGSSPD